MLEHQKKVLSGVSNNPYLFKKELLKSLKWLNHDELAELQKWLKQKYGDRYASIIANDFLGGMSA